MARRSSGNSGRPRSRRRSGSPRNGRNMEDGRDDKRFRIEDPPPIVNGVISASHTPIFDSGKRVAIPQEFHSDGLGAFFNDINSLGEIPQYEIQPSLKKYIASSSISEEKLRNAVYTELLDHHNINFPTSSFEEPKKKRHIWGKRLPGEREYKETDVKSLLVEYGKMIGFEIPSMNRIMSRLPVTITSKPDLVPLVDRDSGNVNGEVELSMGEFRNRSAYKEENARAQCTMYLIGLLYWLRAVRGKPVEAVYGFYFCGRKCSGGPPDNYTVGLIKLSAPQYLGESAKTEYFSVSRPSKDLLPVQFLIHFLRHGKRWVRSPPPIQDLENKETIPALYALPSTLWVNESYRTLVLNSTLAIVFHVSCEGLMSLLTNPQYFPSEIKNDRIWK